MQRWHCMRAWLHLQSHPLYVASCFMHVFNGTAQQILQVLCGLFCGRHILDECSTSHVTPCK